MPLALRRALYAAVVFWSALLLLLVQPVITKSILPWFGGSAGVWTTSMLFFQTVLLLGYVYAHVITRVLPIRGQVIAHIALMLLALLFLPLHASERWKPGAEADPVWHILGLLFVTAGLPYFLLSTTSPLLQSWYSRTVRTDLPWRLFAISNLGSLCALLCYPVLIEPELAIHEQLLWWSIGFGAFVALCSAAALLTRREAAPVASAELPAITRMLTWVALAAVPSVMWLAVANKLSQDIAAVPFLWILPLSLYLFSFVLTFDSDRWYRPRLYRWLLPLGPAALIAIASQPSLRFQSIIALYAVALFLCCMFCHGELARLKPDASQITAYYVTISVGGAIGGIFVGLVAPHIFKEYLELPVGMLCWVILALWLLYGLGDKRVIRIGAVAAAGVVTAILMKSDQGERVLKFRNFYGTLQVVDETEDNEKLRHLYNGAIKHGLQFLAPPKKYIPTTYYGPASGVALALQQLQKNGPVRVGVIGLGAGTMAAYSRPGDYFRFYDINPLVIQIARTEFTYVGDAKCQVDVVQGDARLSLEREQPENFNLLVIDAFSGDSIPVHLLTREAFALYFRHLGTRGALAVHVTNKHLELAPVVKLLASDAHAHSRLIINSDEEERAIYFSDWVIVTKSDQLDQKLAYLSSPIPGRERLRMWTDDYSNLFRILKSSNRHS